MNKFEDKINDIINLTIEQMENKYNIKILFGGVTGSRAFNLHNKTSDIDLSLIYLNKGVGNIQIPIFTLEDIGNYEIHFLSYEISDILNSVKMYSIKNSNQEFPTYFNKNRVKEDEKQSLIFRIISSEYLWDKKKYVKNNYKKLQLTFHRLNILDYYFTRARGNYDNYLNREKVMVRKYLYTLHEIFCIKWILQYNTIPPMDFYELLEKYKSETEFNNINLLLNINKGSIVDNQYNMKLNSKENLKVDNINIINDYIINQLIYIENKIRKLSNNLNDDILINFR